ncbi:MAG: hypothetical protein MPJ24_04060 [Pirellulaceae bacterium]|nr:hypothetical protein [Pirellulaceae bacterium]
MDQPIQSAQLEAFLEEALPPDEMAQIEVKLRNNDVLREKLATIQSRRAAGIHTIGGIWRESRASCPSRGQLQKHLLGILGDAENDYLLFHIESVGCRICQANLEDLRQKQSEAAENSSRRQQKYFHTSAPYFDS